MPAYCPASQHWWWWASIPLEPHRQTYPSFLKVILMFFIIAIESKGRHMFLYMYILVKGIPLTLPFLKLHPRFSWARVEPNYIFHSQCSWALARFSWNDASCEIWIRSLVNIWLGEDCISPSAVLSKWPIWAFAVFLPPLVSFQFSYMAEDSLDVYGKCWVFTNIM